MIPITVEDIMERLNCSEQRARLFFKWYGDNQEKIQSSLFENLLNLYDVLTSSDLINKVSKIDVSDLENIEIYINSENKILQIGNFENLSTKFVWIHTLLEQEEGVPGTIVVKDINEVYFMEVYNKDNENG